MSSLPKFGLSGVELSRFFCKLNVTLKIQLVHSVILCKWDYCNSVYFNMPVNQINKLQRIQNCAVWYIFNNHDRRQLIAPYLKKLHSLPIKYQILLKIALLVFKCLIDIAPQSESAFKYSAPTVLNTLYLTLSGL